MCLLWSMIKVLLFILGFVWTVAIFIRLPRDIGEFIWQPDESILSRIYLVRAITRDKWTATKQIVHLK